MPLVMFFNRLPSWAMPVALFLTMIVTLLTLILIATGGHFSYTLDDPYIHLALAERLAQGHYGINPGEAASPSSSILWPFLLIPGAGTAWHPYLPLVLNIVCGAATVIVIAHLVERLPWDANDPWRGVKQICIVMLLIFDGNLVTQVFNGMEHSLQLLITAICAFGISEALFKRRIPTWCLIAAAAGTAVRYEMIGPALAMAFALAGQRRFAAALLVIFVSAIIPALFGLYLTQLGLPFLPNSVLIKSGQLYLAQQSSAIDSLQAIIIHSVQTVLMHSDHWPFLFMTVAMGLMTCVSPKERKWALAGATAALAGHLFFGRFGWFHRYEAYAILFGLLILYAATIPLSRRAGSGLWLLPLLVICALPYARSMAEVPTAAQNIYEQQYQMHRFVNEFYRKNVAVNDLGWVAYRQQTPFYVLDLVGLGNSESLWAHKSGAWLEEITRQKNVDLAMIYTGWYGEIPSSWIKVGTLKLSSADITPAYPWVDFYATSRDHLPEIRDEIRAFIPTLPPGVTMASD